MTRIIIVAGEKAPVLMESERSARELEEQIRQGFWEVDGMAGGVQGNKLRVHRLDRLVLVIAELPENEQGKRSFPTKRQRQVLQGLGDGLTSKEIARQMGITKRTVEFHISILKTMMNANTRVEILGKAREKGWG